MMDDEVSGKREMWEHYRQTYDHALRICDKPVDSQRMYQHFEETGLKYGPTSQSHGDVAWDGAHTVVG